MWKLGVWTHTIISFFTTTLICAPEYGINNSNGMIVLRLVWMWVKRNPNNESSRQERERIYTKKKELVFSTYIQHCIVVNSVYTSSKQIEKKTSISNIFTNKKCAFSYNLCVIFHLVCVWVQFTCDIFSFLRYFRAIQIP